MRRTSPLLVLFPVLLLLLVVLLASCEQQAGLEDDTSGLSVFRYRLMDDPSDLDPARAHDINSDAVVYEIFDGLVELDAKTMEVVPAVAASWEVSEDARTFTFHLRQGVKFHNGREVVADDVVWSFERALRPETKAARSWVLKPVDGAEEFMAGQSDHVRGLEAPDPRTVRITLKEPFSPFLSQLILEQASILPKEVYDDPAEGYLQHPVGCGPFRWVSWRRGRSVVLEAFPDYYGEGPHIDRLEFRIIRSQDTGLQEFLAGNLELMDEVPPARRVELIRLLGDRYHRWPQLAVRGIGFNHQRPPFAGNPTLRRALSHAVDRDFLLDTINEGKDRKIDGIIPAGLADHDPDLVGYDYDPDRARDLLAEAGYPGGEGLPELSILYNVSAGHKRMLERVAADLAEVGVRVRLTSVDLATFLTRISGTPDEPPPDELIYFAWVGDFPDAFAFLFPNFHSGSRENFFRYRNPAVDEALDRAVREGDAAARRQLYREAERIVVEDAAWIFILNLRDEALVSSDVQGLIHSPLGDHAIPLNRVRLVPAG